MVFYEELVHFYQNGYCETREIMLQSDDRLKSHHRVYFW